MGEWTVVTVIVALVGLFFTIGKPIINLNTNITVLNESIKNIKAQSDKQERDNTEAHRRIWKHNDEQDEQLRAHELRLHDLDGK